MVYVISYHVTGKTKVASVSIQVTTRTFRELQHLRHLTNHCELVISRFMKLFRDPLTVAHDPSLVEKHYLSSLLPLTFVPFRKGKHSRLLWW